MAVKRNIKLPGFNSVAAGSTATIDLPTDLRYHGIYLNYKSTASEAAMEADITEIRVNIDGVTQMRIKPAELFDINRFDKVLFIAGWLPLLFSKPNRTSVAQKHATALGTQGVRTLQLEVDIAGGAVAPTLTAVAQVDDVQEAPQGIIKVYRESIPVTATGERTVRLDAAQGSYERVHLFETTPGDISNVRVMWDGIELHNLSAAANTVIAEAQGYDALSGSYMIPFDWNDITSTVPMLKANGQRVQTFDLILTMAVAAQVNMVRELVGVPN